MIKYKEFSPTSLDPAGLALPDRQNWLVLPVGRNRDSDTLSESNFEAALNQMGGESETLEVHRFGHWARGWFEIIIMHPSRCTEAVEIEAALEDYPVLDEFDHAERQYDAIQEAWADMSLSDKIDFTVENGHSPFAARTSDPFGVNNDCGDAVYSLIEEY